MQNKIYWNGFKRQLVELYYLLLWEKCISCELDEFISHFTGKKFRLEMKYSGKLKWNSDPEVLTQLIKHLIDKRFLDKNFVADYKNILTEHFADIAEPDIEMDTENNSSAKAFKLKLDLLFPENSGYRCKERLFYKQRNQQRISEVLKFRGIN